ncbi:MAG TPA: alpha/beta hydrolase [Aquella sp.]|nr:alpha/beta hydrolase [Aquella sp.]
MLEYKSVKTRSGHCGYATLGSGTPLIMVVGYTGTLFHWHGKFVHELAKHYAVYLIDNRKIGLSDSDNEESMPGFARDIVDFIDALSLNKPCILGWSMGGVAVQELLRNHSDKIKAAILLATVPAISYTNSDFFNFVREADKVSADEYRKGIYYYFFSHDQHEKTKDELTSNALKFSNYSYRFEIAARNLQDRVIACWPGMSEDDLSKIRVPTLLLWAKNDLVVPESAGLCFVNNLPQAKLIIYPSGGHFLLQENYKQIANDIINFIQ